jgi:excisionase family DNA binding protein
LRCLYYDILWYLVSTPFVVCHHEAMTDDLISIARVSQILGVTERTVYRYADSGLLTKHKSPIGRTLLFSESEVWDLLKPRPVG